MKKKSYSIKTLDSFYATIFHTKPKTRLKEFVPLRINENTPAKFIHFFGW